MIAVMDFKFFAGSMGSVVGEKITRAIETAIAEKRGVIIVSASSGARMRSFAEKDPTLESLLTGDFFSGALSRYQMSWRDALTHSIALGIPTPAFSTALAFYDGYRAVRLPANLLQAQRDFFGAHMYERIDKPRGEFFHTNWTGRGGRVSSSTYNA